MLTYSFDNIGNESLYMHLYQCIKEDILEGNLKPGEKLPSKRSFAKNLGVSNITVENAYAQLQAEGYVFSQPKKGFYVTKLPQDAFRQRVSGNLPEEMPEPDRINSSSDDSVFSLDLVSNRTHPEHFPFSIWAKQMREVISNRSDALMKKSPPGGIVQLRQAISQHLRQFRNMQASPEQIIIGAGTEYLYSLIIQLIGFDKVYALEDPGYRKIAQIYESHHVHCEHIEMDQDGMMISRLEQLKADVAHVSPSHHYPTGLVTPVSRRYELLGWAMRTEGRYIIEDDYDSEFRLNGKPLPTLQSIDVADRVIYMNTFTKSLAATIRISYMVLPKPLLERFLDRLGFYSCTVSNFEQYTMAKFITDGYFEKHINRMRNYYRGVRNEIISVIEDSPLSGLCSISEEEAGLHFLLRIDTKLSDEELLKRCLENGLRISCLSQYYNQLPKADSHTLVVNYSGLKKTDIPKITAVLAKCLSDQV